MILEPVIENIPRIYTAIAEWGAVTLFVLLFRRRFSHWMTALILAGGLLAQSGIQIMNGSLPKLLWVPGMLLAVTAMIAMMMICCDLTVKAAIYHGMRAFMLAELAASLEWQLYYFLIMNREYDILFVRVIGVILIYGAIYLAAYLLERRTAGQDSAYKVTERDLVAAVVICILVFTFSNLSFLDGSTPFSSSKDKEIFNIRTLVDFCGYLILYLYHQQQSEMFLRYEKDTMETMLHSQLMQYKLSRESIDLVNRKYHDLKHQIGVLRGETDDEIRNTYLDQLENEIKVYEVQYQTGNKILDTILTSQNLYCLKHGIEMTCIADGTILDFMDVMDICTIFGNALDNAIECELKVSDKSKRIIRVKVFRERQFALIRVMNYCEEAPVLVEGLPMTSKKDHAYHGFGVKSIQASAQKYEGSISVSMENNWFKLLVMIPLKA